MPNTQGQPDRLYSVGQRDSSNILQQEGRNKVPLAVAASKEDVDLVHGEEHICGGRPHSWGGKHDSRRRITGTKGSLGLKTESETGQNGSAEVRSSGDRPVCIQDLHTASTFLQLKTRSGSGGHRCIQPALEGEQLCRPPMGGTSTCSVTRKDTGGQSGSHSTSLEVPSMVPNSTSTSSRLPLPTTSQGVNYCTGSHSSTADQGSRGPVGRMAYIRRSCEERQLSKESTDFLMASWQSKSQGNYNSLFHKWECWCDDWGRNPIQGPVTDVINFLVQLYKDGYSYQSLNSYRSAISSVHEEVDGHLIGQHPMVTRVLKGAFNCRPPKPRYTSTWSVNQVVTWLDQQNNTVIPLLSLAMKAVTLCALSRPCRLAELANLSFQSLSFSPEGITAYPLMPPKQSQPGKAIKEYFFPLFLDNSNICLVVTLRLYCDKTSGLRQLEIVKKKRVVFLISTKPYGPATSASVARWIKTVLSKAGIDTTFQVHSIRGASTLAAAEAGISVPEILEAAGWSNQSTFERFYYRPCKSSCFGTAVLKSASSLQS